MPTSTCFCEIFVTILPPKRRHILLRSLKGTSFVENTHFGLKIVKISQEMRLLSFMAKGAKNDIPGLQTHFGVFRAQRTCLVAANVVMFLSNSVYELKQIVSECNASYRV